MGEKFTYEIGEKKYTQGKLVLGQVPQLLDLLMGLNLPAVITPSAVVLALGNKLPRAFAVVLNPEGVNLKDKDLEEIAADLEAALDIETATKVIEDFLSCNQIASLSKKYKGMAANLGLAKSATGSPKSASSLPKGT